jgi:hypothetical protein
MKLTAKQISEIEACLTAIHQAREAATELGDEMRRASRFVSHRAGVTTVMPRLHGSRCGGRSGTDGGR